MSPTFTLAQSQESQCSLEVFIMFYLLPKVLIDLIFLFSYLFLYLIIVICIFLL